MLRLLTSLRSTAPVRLRGIVCGVMGLFLSQVGFAQTIPNLNGPGADGEDLDGHGGNGAWKTLDGDDHPGTTFDYGSIDLGGGPGEEGGDGFDGGLGGDGGRLTITDLIGDLSLDYGFEADSINIIGGRGGDGESAGIFDADGARGGDGGNLYLDGRFRLKNINLSGGEGGDGGGSGEGGNGGDGGYIQLEGELRGWGAGSTSTFTLTGGYAGSGSTETSGNAPGSSGDSGVISVRPGADWISSEDTGIFEVDLSAPLAGISNGFEVGRGDAGTFYQTGGTVQWLAGTIDINNHLGNAGGLWEMTGGEFTLDGGSIFMEHFPLFGEPRMNLLGGTFNLVNGRLNLGAQRTQGGPTPGDGGQLYLDGGTLKTSQLRFSHFTGRFNFLSGTLHLTDSQVDYGPDDGWIDAVVERAGLFNNRTLIVDGNLTKKFYDSSILNIDGTGELIVGGTFSFEAGSGGFYMNGGSATVGRFVVPDGVDFDYLGGNLTLTNGTTDFRTTISGPLDIPDHDALTVRSGATFKINGIDATGNVAIESGGKIDVGVDAKFGFIDGTTNTLTVDGAGSQLIADDDFVVAISVGATTNATISDGGEVSVNDLTILGLSSNSTGRLTVDNGRLETDQLRVADIGNGHLTITNSGVVEVAGNANLAWTGDSDAFVLVEDSGSELNVAGDFTVGRKGAAELSIRAGADVGVEEKTTVGFDVGSQGGLFVEGAGTTFTTDALYVSDIGSGYVRVSNGASLRTDSAGQISNSGDVQIGWWTSSNGTVEVQDSGSRLDVDEDLVVGHRGVGVLNVTNGGIVDVDADLTIAMLAGSTGTLTINSSSELIVGGTFSIGAGDGDFDLSGGSATVGRFVIPDGSDFNYTGGDLTLTNGITDFRTLIPGAFDIPDDGTFTVRSGASFLANGFEAAGDMVIQSGGKIDVGVDAKFGFTDGTTNTLTVDGAGSQLIAADDFVVAISVGTNTNATISDGGEVSVSDFTILGLSANSTGRLTVDNGRLATDQLRVADIGDGHLTITNAGEVEVTGDANLAWIGDSDASVIVEDSGSEFNVGGNLYVGHRGVGLLSVNNSGLVDVDGDLTIANLAGSTGTLTINSSGELFVGGALSIGAGDGDFDLSGGSATVGRFVIPDGSDFDYTSGDLTLINGITDFRTLIPGAFDIPGDGTFTVRSGASFLANGFEAAGDMVIQSGGKIDVGVDAKFGFTDGTTNTLTVDGAGSQLIAADDFVVAISVGTNTNATISDGGEVSVSDFTILGLSANSTGRLTVDNGRLATDQLRVADIGDGHLTITNGGEAEVTGDANLAWIGGSDASVIVEDSGSELNVGGNFYVGRAGSGDLTIRAGADVEAAEKTTVGFSSGSQGNLYVDGAGTTFTTDALYVSDIGSGLVRVSNGASLQTNSSGLITNSGDLQIGWWTSSNGTVEVQDSGSRLDVDENLVVGHRGVGVLNITNGGIVESDGNANIGLSDGSDGEVTVAGTNSELIVNGALTIGTAGEGSLTIGTGGEVNSTGTVTIADGSTSTGTLILDGGTLITPTLTTGSGTASIDLRSGQIQLTGQQTIDAGMVTLLGLDNLAAGGVDLQMQDHAQLTGSGADVILAGGTWDLTSHNLQVLAGASIGGSGTIDGAVTIDSNSSINPGNSPGTLTVEQLTLSAGSILNFELATPGIVGSGINDLIDIEGDLILDGILNVTALDGFGAGSYQLMSIGGSLTQNNGLEFGSMPAGYNFELSTFTSGQVNLVVSAVPEPAAFAMVMSLMALTWAKTRRRRLIAPRD